MRNRGLLFLSLWYAFPISKNFFPMCIVKSCKEVDSQNVHCILSCIGLKKKENMQRDGSFEVSSTRIKKTNKKKTTQRCIMKIEKLISTKLRRNAWPRYSNWNTGWQQDTCAETIPTLMPTIGDTAPSVRLQGRCYHHRLPPLSNMSCCRESQDNEFSFFYSSHCR